jgi:mannosyltransferase
VLEVELLSDEDRLRDVLTGAKVNEVNVHSGAVPRSIPTSAVGSDRIGMGTVAGIAVAASVGLLPWLGMSRYPDEGATLYSAHLSWSNLWAQSLHVDLVLLPYYVLIHFWLILSGSIVWIRALSLFAYCGTIVAVGFIGLRIAGRWCGIIAAVLTATSTLLVEKSLTARPYELSTFLVAMCAAFLFRWLDDSRSRWLWAFSILALLATAAQLFFLLAPISMLVCVLVVRPELIARRLRVLFAPVALLAIGSGVWAVACMGEAGQVNWIASESIGSRLFEEVRGPAIGQFYDLVLFVIAALVVFKLAANWTRDVRYTVVELVSRDRDFLALAIGWAVVPTVVLALASLVHPIYSVRYVAASAPGLALLAAFGCVRAFPKSDPSRVSDRVAHKHVRSPLLAIFGTAAAVLLAIGYRGSASAQQEDLLSPARYVAQHAQRGDAIALTDHAITSAVDYYLAIDDRHIPLWTQLGVRQRYIEGFDLSLHPSGGYPRRVWLLDDGGVAGVARFERALGDEGYVVRNYKQFNGLTLFIYYSPLSATTVVVPSSGATISGTNATLIASQSAYGTTKVQFVLSDGSYAKTVIGTAVLTNYGDYLPWNTTSVPNGTYSIRSVITDERGRSSDSTAVTIKVDNSDN